MSVCAVYRRVPPEILKRLISDPESKIEQVSETIDLDKSWDAVHLFMTGSNEESKDPLSQAIHGGGKAIGDIEDGFYYLEPKQVSAIAKAFASKNPEELAKKMREIDPEELEEMDLYSFDCDNVDDTVEEAHMFFEKLQKFYKKAASEGQAVLISMG